jgi:hypothetical protein
MSDNESSQNNNLQDSSTPEVEISKTSDNKPKSRLFVPATLLFCLPLILLLNQISVTLKFPDFYSYTLLIVGAAFFARSYIVSFLTLNHSYFGHKWFVFSVNLLFTIVSFWTAYTAIADLSFNSYPEHWFVSMATANLIFLAQLWINRIFSNSYFQTQLIQIIFIMISIGALWQKILVDQRWFLGLLSIIVAVFEVFLATGVVKLLFVWEQNQNDEV